MPSSPHPFASPSHPVQHGQQARSLHSWSLATQAALALQGACLLATALFTPLFALGSVLPIGDLWSVIAAVSTLVTTVSVLAALAAIIGWLRWQWLASSLVAHSTEAGSAPDPRGASAVRRSPTWHLLSWVIPVIALWYPLQNVADLDREGWRREHNPAAPARPARTGDPGSGLRRLWWSCWLAWSVVSTLGMNAGSMTLTLLGHLLGVAAAGTAVLLVRRISDALTGRTSPLPEILRTWGWVGPAPTPAAS